VYEFFMLVGLALEAIAMKIMSVWSRDGVRLRVGKSELAIVDSYRRLSNTIGSLCY